MAGAPPLIHTPVAATSVTATATATVAGGGIGFGGMPPPPSPHLVPPFHHIIPHANGFPSSVANSEALLHYTFPSEADTLAYVDALKHSDLSDWRSLQEVAARAGGGSCSGAVTTSVLTALYLLGLFNLCAASPASCCVPPASGRRRRRRAVDATLPPLLNNLQHNLSSLSLEQFRDLPHVTTSDGGRIPLHISVVDQVRKLWDSNPRLLSSVSCSSPTESVRSSFISLSGVASGIILAYSVAQLTQCYPDHTPDKHNPPKIWFFPIPNTVADQSQFPIPIMPGEIPVRGDDEDDDGCERNEVPLGMDKCAPLLSAEFCPYKHWVLLNKETGMGECVPRLCSENFVYVEADEMCHDINEPGICPGNRRLYLTASGHAVCDCPEGMFPGPQDYCYYLHEPAFCGRGSVLQFDKPSKSLVCKSDPCSEVNKNLRPNDLPYAPRSKDGFCYQFNEQGPCKKSQRFGFDTDKLEATCVSLREAGLVRPRRSYMYQQMSYPGTQDHPFAHYQVSYIIVNGTTWDLEVKEIGRNKRDIDSTLSAHFLSTGKMAVPFIDTREIARDFHPFMKPRIPRWVINKRKRRGNHHSSSSSDHSSSGRDHSSSGRDHSSSVIEHSSSGRDHSSSSRDHSSSVIEHSSSGRDHSSSGRDHSSSGRDHSSSVIEHSSSGRDHSSSSRDHSSRIRDHSRSGRDHSSSSRDHSSRIRDHSRSGRDHSSSSRVQSSSERDHSSIDRDHSSIGRDHSSSSRDHSSRGRKHKERSKATGTVLSHTGDGEHREDTVLEMEDDYLSEAQEETHEMGDKHSSKGKADVLETEVTHSSKTQTEEFVPKAIISAMSSVDGSEAVASIDDGTAVKRTSDDRMDSEGSKKSKGSSRPKERDGDLQLASQSSSEVTVFEVIQSPRGKKGEVTGLQSDPLRAREVVKVDQSKPSEHVVVHQTSHSQRKGKGRSKKRRRKRGRRNKVSSKVKKKKKKRRRNRDKGRRRGHKRGRKKPSKSKDSTGPRNPKRKGPKLPFRVPTVQPESTRNATVDTSSESMFNISKDVHSSSVDSGEHQVTGSSESSLNSSSVHSAKSDSSGSVRTKPHRVSETDTSDDEDEGKEKPSSSSSESSLPKYLRHRGRRQLGEGGGIIQAPLLSACKPGAKRDYNYKCRPKFIPQERERRSESSSPSNVTPRPPRISCPKGTRLDPRGKCQQVS